jgi:hypothetical protein
MMARATIDPKIIGIMTSPPLTIKEKNILYLLNEKIGQSKLPYGENKVPGRGIEPRTRGFSVQY